jgi:outer membrane cobalamin receptor
MSFISVKESFDDYKESYPDRSGYIGGHYKLNQNNQLSGAVYYVDKMSWTDQKREIDDYTKLDLRYQYTIDSKHDFTLELIGQNLFEDYNDYTADRFHSKNYLLRLSGRF